MQKLTASNLVSFINNLDKNLSYNYVNPKTKGLIKIDHIILPEGPIYIRRWNPFKGESENNTKAEPISTELIWRIANAFIPNIPINFDRILGASYNTRSVFEALLAHTPQFYYCYPGRIENKNGIIQFKEGHKHLIWKPDLPHISQIIVKADSQLVVSEIPSTDAFYESLALPDIYYNSEIDIETKRRHSQIQIALYFIGTQLNYRTWIAQNDKGIVYQNKRISEYDGVIASLGDEKLMQSYSDASKAASMIDCIWFKNGKLMPAVMEIEHSTGVTSGLTRMKHFYDLFPPYPTRYVIVAPDEDRDKVVREINKPQFRDLNAKYFPYSAVEELFALCNKRKIKGVTEEFLDCYMESVLSA